MLPSITGGALLERDAAIGEIEGALRCAAGGDGSVAFLVGAAGLGKTSLIELAGRAARAAGFAVGSAVGSPMEAGLPFGLVGQALISLGGSPVDDPAALERLGGQSARFYRVFRWLCDVAARGPLLLALDDLHWADPDSLALIGFVCRRLSGNRIFALGALRPEPDPAWALAQELVGSGHARLMRLQPLTRQASATLIERNLARPLAASERDWAWRACAGTPLLLETAASMLGREGSLPEPGQDGAFGAPLLLERFVGLDADTFAYVRAAAILGMRFHPPLAGALAGLDEPAASIAHERLLRARLLEDLPGGWSAFVHPLFAQTLLETRSLSERERAHAQAFRLLVERGEPDALAAEHAAAARLVGDPLAVEVAARAGRAAMAQGALAAGAAHLASALELAGEGAGVELLLDYATAAASRASFEEAERVCGELLAQSDLDPAARVRALALLARAASVAGSPVDAERLYGEAASAAAAADPLVEAATLIDAAITCQISSPVGWVNEIVSRALPLTAGDGSARRSLEVLAAYGALLGADPSGADLIVGEARRWAERAQGDDHAWTWTLGVHLLNAFKVLEDFDGATEMFEREFERAIEDGAPILIHGLAIAYADAAHRLGRPLEGVELVQRAIALNDWQIPPWTDLALAALFSELGRDDEATAHIEAVRSFLAGVTQNYHAPVWLWLYLIDAWRLLAAGEAQRASEAMLHAAQVAELTGWRHPCIVPWAGVGIDAHLAAGRLDRVRDLIEGLEELSRPLSSRWPHAVAALGRARLAAADGDGERSDGLFARALELFGELPMPIAHAEALTAYGLHLRRSNRPRQAREPLARALAIAERCSAERVARTARAELAAAGGRRRRREEGANELTAQEKRVAALAADGLSNAQIAAALHVSAKTVGHHLQHVYSKLGIRSRRELIRHRSELL